MDDIPGVCTGSSAQPQKGKTLAASEKNTATTGKGLPRGYGAVRDRQAPGVTKVKALMALCNRYTIFASLGNTLFWNLK